jgi:hypothetical protein
MNDLWAETARSHGWISSGDHNQRTTELIEANNREVERRRSAEQEMRRLRIYLVEVGRLAKRLEDVIRHALYGEITHND